jgi:hypothetical protein
MLLCNGVTVTLPTTEYTQYCYFVTVEDEECLLSIPGDAKSSTRHGFFVRSFKLFHDVVRT